MVEQTIWLWFGWDCFIAHRGFIIIERTDSWKRQLTAGRDSSVIWTALKTRTKLVFINYNSILVQILIVRHNEESTGLQDSHHRVLINRHSPLTMFRKVEDCLFGFQLPCKGTCLIHKHCNLQEWCDRFFRKYISVATTKIRLRGSTLSHTQQHIRIPEPPSHGSGCFSNFGQSQKYFILIGCFLGPGSYVKLWSYQVEQSGDRQVVLNCHREGHFVFLLYKSTVLSAHCLFLL